MVSSPLGSVHPWFNSSNEQSVYDLTVLYALTISVGYAFTDPP